MLQSMWSQRVRHNLVTKQQVCGMVIGGEWTEVMEVPGCLLVEA